ncbi:MAG: cytidine deaminase [Clostridia bacterium]|nr:cytidine deaminase [Clostridia bacterium]MBR5780012.1 cytidine deaminase [Clostridia bacterium]
MTDLQLIKMAENAANNAYSPYSGFKVGAALLARDGRVFCGCNIENGSYSATICAERVAMTKAVSEGVREFESIAIVGGIDDFSKPCMPCGVCRQFISEFCGGDFRLIFKNNDAVLIKTLDELLPNRFEL